MNEFEVLVTPKAGSIETNFVDIEAKLKAEMSAYEGMEVTDENLADSKKDLAFLRKVKKSINDKKVDIKKQYMQPYTEFEDKCKQLIAVVDKPIEEIDKQIKDFDVKRIADKKVALEKLYAENIEEFAEYIPFESTLEDSWSNVSYKDKDYLYYLSEKKISVRGEIEVIKALNSEIEEEILNIYKKSGLAMAIQRNTQYLNDKNRVSEQIKADIKNGTVKVEKPSAIDSFVDFQKKLEMVAFYVSKEDAEQVEQFLHFSNITYRKEI